jgi:formate dehydrogenase major subunit
VAYIFLNIDGQEVRAHSGQTLLEAASANGIEIPTLCHDERVKAFGSCGVCLVEVEGMPRLARSCSTAASDGMVVRTGTKRVLEARVTALEFMLSDHSGDCRPPCVKACPANTDCQGYVGLIANGEYKAALELIKEVIPLPASIGRVCPHPCEEACRRELVEEPVGIAQLKAFAADVDIAARADAGVAAKIDGAAGVGVADAVGVDAATESDALPGMGKRVAVIGGGPGGLSAAYFLRRLGHGVTEIGRAHV